MSRTRTTLTTLAAGLTLAAGVTALAPAPAGASDAVIRTGSCTGSSDWKVKAKHDDGRIEFEGEVDSNKVGQTWRWRLVHNGSLSARGIATTRAPSGSFTVERRVVDLDGVDTLVFRARNPRTDEVCRGRVRL